jgi:hypothetical protein
MSTDSADGVYINFGDEFTAVDDDLAAARKAFLDTSNSYDGDGERFKEIVIARLEEFRDPENRHAEQVQKGAITAIYAIRKFASTHAFLTSQVAMLLTALNMKVLATATDMIPVGVFETPADPSSVQEIVDNYVNNLDAWQRESAAKAAGAILLGHQVADAVRAAAQPISMRQGTLEQAARELAPDQLGTPAGITQVVEVGGEPVAEELKMMVLDEILKRAAFELGTHIPIAGIVVSVVRVASDIRARQAALRERYELQLRIREIQRGRGAIDVMFDLPAQLQDEDQITEGVRGLMEQLVTSLL